MGKAGEQENLNGSAPKMLENLSGLKGITDVGRHGEMVCVCSQSLEAETLEQLVRQNGTLPLELATETLLQTAKTLQKLQEQGLSLHKVSPEWLLLDEDGQVHLMGNSATESLLSAICHCSDQAPPIPGLYESLGQLYAFLQTGQTDLPFAEDTAFAQSAKQVQARLLEPDDAARYRDWNELIRDLECLLAGQPISPPAGRTEVPSSSPMAEVENAPVPGRPKSNRRWLIIALAVLAAAIIAGVLLLRD